MPASIAPVDPSLSLPLAGRFYPDTPFGQRFQAVIDSLLETAPERVPPVALTEPRSLAAL